MVGSLRFGRRIPLPATVAIKHELRMLMHEEKIHKLKQQLKEISDAELDRSEERVDVVSKKAKQAAEKLH